MNKIPESELILNKDGSVYHLNIKPEHISDIIITVADPGRVFKVSDFFDNVDFEMNTGEFITQIGNYKGKKVTVISSGTGTDNIEILLTELDALVNIDLHTREIKENKKKLKIIRIGTSGSLQTAIPVGAHLVSEYAIGLGHMMYFYNLVQTEFEDLIAKKLQEKAKLPFRPYCVDGSEKLRQQFASDMIKGNTVTCPGFYGPQGRKLRLDLRIPDLLADINYFNHENFWITDFDMETAGLHAFARLLGHEMLSVSAITYNRITNEVSKNPDKLIEGLIKKVLERL